MSRNGLRMVLVMVFMGMLLTAISYGQRSPSPPRTARLAALGIARANIVVPGKFQIASSLPREETVRGNDLAAEESGDEDASEDDGKTYTFPEDWKEFVADQWKDVFAPLGIVGGVMILVVAAFAFVFWLMHAFFLVWGAKKAGIRERTLTGAMLITIVSGAISFVFKLLLSIAIPAHAAIVASLAGFLITAAVMTVVFKTTFSKALWATVLAWVLQIVVVLLLVVLLVGC
ncbi:MAG: hypothetical protein ACLFWL_06970 [Candidatus Brocadiia bacterium]